MSIEQRENADYLKLKAENRKKILDYVVGSNDGKADFYPRYIQIEQTNKCNARCIMCNHFYLANNGANIYKMLGKNIIGLIKKQKDADLNCVELISHLAGKYYGSIKNGIINI